MCCRPDGSRAEIYLKREDLNHTGAHKINNSLGQALLCLRMNKRRIIAETGAGQHGVATVIYSAQKGGNRIASCTRILPHIPWHIEWTLQSLGRLPRRTKPMQVVGILSGSGCV